MVCRLEVQDGGILANDARCFGLHFSAVPVTELAEELCIVGLAEKLRLYLAGSGKLLTSAEYRIYERSRLRGDPVDE